MAWILVTPASRGIGAALTRHLLHNTPASVPIVATARSDIEGVKEKLLSNSSELSDSQRSRLDVQTCDVLSESSITDLSSYCRDRYGGGGRGGSEKSKNDQSSPSSSSSSSPPHLRLAFMIPGMLVPERAPEKIEYSSALDTLKLNLLAPMMLVKYFAALLPRKASRLGHVDGLPDFATLALMSARVGSIGDNGLGGWYSYRSSKAGVNQLVKSTDIHLKMQSGQNALCVGLHPGTVKTGLSEEFWNSTPKEKLFTPEFSAEKLIDVVKGLEVKQRGRCWDWQGKEIPP